MSRIASAKYEPVRTPMRLGLVTPSSPFHEPEYLERALVALGRLGFETSVGRHVGERDRYLAGPAEDRASDLHEAFADPEVDAVLAIRGGYGAAELVPLLDAELLKANAKPFIGMSDLTVLHLVLSERLGLPAFLGPVARHLPPGARYTARP